MRQFQDSFAVIYQDRICNMMSSLGLAGLYDYKGGFDDWKKLGKPVEK